MTRKNSFGYTPPLLSKISREEYRMIHELEESERSEGVFARAVGSSRAQLWVKQHGLVLSGARIGIGAFGSNYSDYRHWFIERLICKEKRKEFAKSNIVLPLDHVEVWRKPKSRELVCITSQPYGISNDSIVGLARLSTDFGLCVEIYQTHAWYYASVTELIEIWRSAADMRVA